MEILIEKLFETFSLEYMFSVIVATYLFIKFTDALNGDRVVPTWLKWLITCGTGFVLFIVFYFFTEETFERLITSFFAAVFAYDGAIKFLIERFNAGYRK